MHEDETEFAAVGVVKLDGVVDTGLLAAVKSAAARAFERADASAPLGAHPRAVSVFDLGLPFAIDELVADRRFGRLASIYLGSARLHELSHVRRMSPHIAERHLPFHQDETIVGERLLNVWIALDACGVNAPGLEFVRGSWSERLPVSPTPDAQFPVERARIADETVVERFGRGALRAPNFAAGDAVVFSGRTAHRTYSAPGMTKDRMSVELRLVPAGEASRSSLSRSRLAM